MGGTKSSMIHDTDADDKEFLKIVIIYYAKSFSITLLYYSKTEKWEASKSLLIIS